MLSYEPSDIAMALLLVASLAPVLIET